MILKTADNNRCNKLKYLRRIIKVLGASSTHIHRYNETVNGIKDITC
jgi:hypothetical protein